MIAYQRLQVVRSHFVEPSNLKITVHHLNNSRSLRIIWLLEELGLPYDIVHHKRKPSWAAPKELRAVHPLGHAPVVVIEDRGQRITLAESGAIIEYLISRYGSQLGPDQTDDEQVARYLYYLHFVEGTYMPLGLIRLLMSIAPNNAPWGLRSLASSITSGVDKTFVAPRMKDALDYMENDLKGNGGEWLVGNRLTGADIMASYALEGTSLKNYPTLQAYIDKLKELSSRKRAEEKGGKNDFAAFAK